MSENSENLCEEMKNNIITSTESKINNNDVNDINYLLICKAEDIKKELNLNQEEQEEST